MKKAWYIIKSDGHIKCADKRQAMALFNADNHMYVVHSASSCPSSSCAKKYYF